MKIYPEVKNFLRKYSHLIDEGKKDDFMDLLYEEGLNSEEVTDLFTILNSINPAPIPNNIRIDHVLKTLKHLIEIVSNLTPAEWRNNYYWEDAIDEDGDLLLNNLLQGFRMHTYGFSEEEFAKLARVNKDKIGWEYGGIYW